MFLTLWRPGRIAVALVAFTLATSTLHANQDPSDQPLEAAIAEILPVLQGAKRAVIRMRAFETRGGAERESFEIALGREPEGAWQLEVRVDGRRGRICFEPGARTWLEVGHAGRVICSDTATTASEAHAALELDALLRDAALRWPVLERGLALLRAATPKGCIGLLKLFAGLRSEPSAASSYQLQLGGEAWQLQLGSGAEPFCTLLCADGGQRFVIDREEWRGPLPLDPTQAQFIASEELDAMLRRAFLRAASLMHERDQPISTTSRVTKHDAGELRIENGFRTLLLSGEPQAMGRAHGALLAEEVRANIDATLAVVGLVYTVERERWFLSEIREAWNRLEPHISPRHLAELDGIADGAGIPRAELRVANVFPELFHCSGFAFFGSATVDGEMLHGRVLDYMTEIGLQRNAVLLVQAPAHGFAFANVGYAGFVGSVTGCNERGLSIGEMGGRGEGDWDGEPMAFLLRRALEEAHDVPSALQVYKEAPRTCEYFYVMAHGPTREAVGVAAWPRRIEILGPGVAHVLLPHAVRDAVLLSAGKRYEELVRRVRAGHGRFDVEQALRLMDPGVAMGSNLHNALFVPARGEIWIAHAAAGGDRPAATQPYTKISLRPLFADLRGTSSDFEQRAQDR